MTPKFSPITSWTNTSDNKLIIAGPCSIESKEQLFKTTQEILDIYPLKIVRAGVWKNRTRHDSFKGVGDAALPWIKELKEIFNIEVAIEVSTVEQIQKARAANINFFWIGARTSVNPILVEELALEIAKDKSTKVMIKNPIQSDINAWIGAIERFTSVGLVNIVAIHRGTYPYKKSIYRNNPDWQLALKLKHHFPTLPIIADPSHMTGDCSLIKEISQFSYDLNMDGLIIEVHNNPNSALSDKEQQLSPKEFKKILDSLILKSLEKEESCINELSTLREKIDSCDFELLNILSKRMEYIFKIAEIKKKHNLPILKLSRFDNMLLKRLEHASTLSLRKDFVTDLMQLIHAESIEMQHEINISERKL